MPVWLSFRGFIAQKCKCLYLYSDIGTTFVGIHHELRELRKLSALEAHQSNRLEFANSETMTTHFTTPHSPHFGELWEAGMSSIKYHLKELVGIMACTFEELGTLLTHEQACLNSCPLTALSNDRNDLMYLSPGNFLIGAPLTSFPKPSLFDLSVICLGGSTGNRSNNIFGKGDP
jgi:hypothetical protein